MTRQFKSTDTSRWAEKFGNGSDGVGSINTSTFAEANETITGTSGETTGTAGGTSIATNDLVLIHQTQGTGAGAWELNKVTSGGSTSLTFKYPLCNTYGTGAQIVKLKQYSSLTVNGSQTWSSSTWNGSKGGILGFLCNRDVTITGTINASGLIGSAGGTGTGGAGKGQRGGAGVNVNGLGYGYTGDGTQGNQTASQTSSGSAGGGGVAGLTNGRGPGGGGGNAAAGTGGTGATGDGSKGNGGGGAEGGNAALTSMIPGGGGGGSCTSDANPTNVAGGGGGGGIVFIIGKTITITGSIVTNGGQGVGDPSDAGSGGGAGGSVLLKGQVLTLGTNLITAAAGGGGSGVASGNNGGAGSVGRIHVDFLTSLTGTTIPTATETIDPTLSVGGGGGFLFNFV